MRQLAANTVLFVILVTLLIGFAPNANAVNCGTVTWYFAFAQQNATPNFYGNKANQTIYDQTICGSSTNEGSVVANGVLNNFGGLTNDFVQVGYYKGWGPNGAVTGADKHYFWDHQYLGFYSFSDITNGLGKKPNVGETILFQVQGSLDTGAHLWFLTITKTGSYTISINNIQQLADYTTTPSDDQLESHNNHNTGTTTFTSLQWLHKSGSSWSWNDWSSGTPHNTSPYCTTKFSETHYEMYTLFSGC